MKKWKQSKYQTHWPLKNNGERHEARSVRALLLPSTPLAWPRRWVANLGLAQGAGTGVTSTCGRCTRNTSQTKTCRRSRERSTEAVPEGGGKVSKLLPGSSAMTQVTWWQEWSWRAKDRERKRRKTGGKRVLGKENKIGEEKGGFLEKWDRWQSMRQDL